MAIDKNLPGVTNDENAAGKPADAKMAGGPKSRTTEAGGRMAAMPGNTHDT